MSRDSHEVINVRDPGIADAHYPPQSDPNQASHGMSNFVDGSGPIFSMYLETATEEDKKMAENWKADAEGILIFTGLFSAAVASLISASIQDIRPNPQDTSNFYLANIYQTVADPNSSNTSNSLPSPPSFSPPNYAVWVNALWFMSLVISLTCALLATLLQQWARRYLKVTQPHYSPHKRARIRSFFFEGVDKYLVSFLVDALPALLHISLYLFFGGLVVFLCNVDLTIFALVLSWVCFCTAIYGFITFIPIFRYNSPYYTPLTSLAWPTVTGTSFVVFQVLLWFSNRFDCFSYETYYRFRNLAERYRKLLVQGMQKTAEETALNSPSEIDTRAFMWTFDSLDEDHELERFFFGLPGFRSSKVVDDPLPGLSWEQKTKLLNALIGLSDRTSSSDLLPELVKNRRAAICAKALGLVEVDIADLHLLQGIMSERELRPVESVGIATLLRDWGYTKGENISMVALAVVSIVVASARLRDDLWFSIASDELGVPESVLRNYAAHGDSLSLAILVHITRQQFSHFRNEFWPWRDFSEVLIRASNFSAQDTSPELQHGFCALWNQIVREAQNDDDPWMAVYILGPIRNVYTALHQGTDSAPTRFSAPTDESDDILCDPSSYPVCSCVAGRIHEVSASTTFPRIPALVPPPLDTYVPGSFHPAHPTAPEILRIPATPPDLATASAIRDIVTSGITIPHPTPETPTSAPPSPTSPPATVALQHNLDLLIPSVPPILPSSNPLLHNILPTGPPPSSHLPITQSGPSTSFPESHRIIIVTTAPDASPGPTSAPDLGAAAEDVGGPKPVLLNEKNDPGPSSAVQASTTANLDLLPQSPSLPLVADSDVAVADPTPCVNVERSRHHPLYPSHDRYNPPIP